MSFGLGHLKLAPRDFWSLSLPELNAALRVHFPDSSNALSRTELNELMQINPDKQSESV